VIEVTEEGAKELVSSTQIPLYGATIFRTPDWDRDGMLYCPVGWTMWAGAYRDLTGDANLNTLNRLYNIQIAWEGGWVLPGWDRKTDPDHNPGGAPMDLPSDLEGAVVQEVENRLGRPNRWVLREKTPGGTDTQYDVRLNEEFSTDTLPVFLSYRTPKAVFV